MKIYIDVLFFVNLIMDMLILKLALVLDRRKVGFLRLAAGGMAGAFIYCLFVGFAIRNLFLNALVGIFSIGISVCVTFKPQKRNAFLRIFGFSIFASIIVGGSFIAAFNIIDIKGMVMSGIKAFSFNMMIVFAVLFYIVMKVAGGMMSVSVSKRQNYCRAKIFVNEKWAEFTVLMDTGNFLVDDGNGRKIIIAEFSSMKDILSAETQLLYLKRIPSECIKDFVTDKGEAERMFVIPFSSLGSEGGSLTAYKLDFAELYNENKTVIKNAAVAVYNGSLSQNGGFGGIINPCILDN